MTLSPRTFFDTNVLVYLFDRAAAAKQGRARELFTEHAEQGSLLLSTQVLQEFYVTVTRKLSEPLTSDEAVSVVEHLSSFSVVQVDPAMIARAGRRQGREMISFWDALIVEAALAGGASLLLSEDMQHGQRIGKVLIRNPFTGY